MMSEGFQSFEQLFRVAVTASLALATSLIVSAGLVVSRAQEIGGLTQSLFAVSVVVLLLAILLSLVSTLQGLKLLVKEGESSGTPSLREMNKSLLGRLKPAMVLLMLGVVLFGAMLLTVAFPVGDAGAAISGSGQSSA